METGKVFLGGGRFSQSPKSDYGCDAPIRCNRDGIEQPTKGEAGGIEFYPEYIV